MNKNEKIDLYNRAKEAYYNGEEIMSDLEFDALEKELGLENKSYVGARHNPSYTVQHPFIMGSLSKVQIHEVDGKVDWAKYLNDAKKYFGNKPLIMTPKYDGCSFEIHVNVPFNTITISTRGDGTYGRDIYDHIIAKVPDGLLHLNYPEYTLRGEVLVKKSTFEQKYAEQFTNPRSFVAGVLGRDYNDSYEFNELLNDLDIVVYDFRTADEDGNWLDHDWDELPSKYNVFPDRYWTVEEPLDTVSFEWYYNDFEEWRRCSNYALDGFVIKPRGWYRKNNFTEPRPKDCIAIKFIPMLEETEIVDITWNLGKTGEYIPIIWVNPVEMDGRMVQKCSGHNYGLLKEKNIGIGSKIIMSLAGDIIPFLYKVTQEGGTIPMPDKYRIDGLHLMAELTDEEIARNQFINSAMALNIPNIGRATAEAIFDSIANTDAEENEFFGESVTVELPTNILTITPEQVYFGAGGGKAGNNAMKSFKAVVDSLTLNDIIRSFNFKFCGTKVTEQVVNYLLGMDYNFASMASEGYQWCKDNNSDEMKLLTGVLAQLGKTIDDFKEHAVEESKKTADQIPVILTGEPNNYKSKGEFLQFHPEYRVTGSWKEVQIVFTNSLDSNTGKMKKAREKGIEIRVY